MTIDVQQVTDLSVEDFRDVLQTSGLGRRRPIDDIDRLARMLSNSNLTVVALDTAKQRVVGVARSLTDFAYCCYLADLAVDVAYQGQGLGRRLIQKTRDIAGPESMCLLLSAPDAIPFYKAIGMPQPDNAFLYPRDR